MCHYYGVISPITCAMHYFSARICINDLICNNTFIPGVAGHFWVFYFYRMGPVSYTHLDVYKRQLLCVPGHTLFFSVLS